MGEDEVKTFLGDHAVRGHGTASTQNLELAALLYPDGKVLDRPLGDLSGTARARRREITVRDGKGRKDRVSMLPGVAEEPLRLHMDAVRRLHQRDLSAGLGCAPLPDALARKYPRADRDWG
jgi:hypothetical protein